MSLGLTTFSRWAAPVSSLLIALGLPGDARAQPPRTDRSFEVQLWQTAIGPQPYFTLDAAEVPGHLQFSLALSTSYQRNPFTLYTVQGENQMEASVEVVRDQVTSELAAAIGIADRLQLGFALPVSVFQDGQDFTDMGVASGFTLSGASAGDLRLEAKYKIGRLGPSKELAFAIAPGLSLPTGNQRKFTGDRNVTGRVRALSELRLGPARAGAMLGVLLRQSSANFAAEVGHQLMYAAAVDYRVHRGVSLLAELLGRSGISDFSRRYVDANPVEVDAGMRVMLPKLVSLTLGGGVGLVRGIGSPKFRAFLALGWSPSFIDDDRDGVYDFEDRCLGSPEDRDGHRDDDGCPELDNDGDGLLDPQDQCPGDAEDADQYQDGDGCPEADNDSDGIADLNDACPNAGEDGRGKRPRDGCPSSSEDGDGDGVSDATDKCADEPEDRDGFEDDDGCPDIDNDGDGIPDNFDECPNEAEDADGVDDTDGCADPDNDRDGFDDASDRCPAQPETLNGNRDDDGCPDPGAELVQLTENTIELRERISFTGPPGQPLLTPAAQTLLNLVALVLKGHREIGVLRMEVRADGTASAHTQARADAIQVFLVGKGVPASRLRAVGAGAGGNRVSFIIESRTTKKERGEPETPAAP
jgi:OmpA-OmpF porin, OOP family